MCYLYMESCINHIHVHVTLGFTVCSLSLTCTILTVTYKKSNTSCKRLRDDFAQWEEFLMRFSCGRMVAIEEVARYSEE